MGDSTGQGWGSTQTAGSVSPGRRRQEGEPRRPGGAPCGVPRAGSLVAGRLWPWPPCGQGSARLPLAALLISQGPDSGGPVCLFLWLLLPSSRECSVLTVACCRRLYRTRSTEGVGLCVSFLSVPSRGPVTHGHFLSVCPKMKGCWGVLPAGAFRFEAAGLRAQTWCDLPVLEKPAFPWHGRVGRIRVGAERETGEGRSRAG